MGRQAADRRRPGFDLTIALALASRLNARPWSVFAAAEAFELVRVLVEVARVAMHSTVAPSWLQCSMRPAVRSAQ